MLNLIGLGIVMGLAFALPPGVVMAETFRRAVTRGFPAALGVQLGSLIGDASWALVALAGLALLVQNPVFQRVLGVAGTAYLIYLAVSGLRQQRNSSPVNGTPPQRSAQHGAFVAGALLSLTNPWAIGFWLSLGGALASSEAATSLADASIFFLSFFGVCVAYCFVVAALAGFTLRALPARVGRMISILCSLTTGVLGLWFGYRVMLTIISG